MDTETYATIAAFLILTFADQGMTALWAWRLGPNRARDMILKDPLFHELRTSLDSTNELLASYKGELLEVRNDMRSLRDFTDKALATASRDTRTSIREDVRGIDARISDMALEIKGFQLAKAEISIPEAEITRVTNSVKASTRAALKDGSLLEGMEKILDAKMERLGSGDEDLEGLLQDAELGSEEGKQASYDWLMEKGLPEPYAYRAAAQGPKMIRKIAKLKGWDVLELMEGA